jgi:hypothetical protein
LTGTETPSTFGAKSLNFMQKTEYRQTQMFAMVEELYQSKMSRKEFCWQKDISMNCFYYWQKKYRQQDGVNQPGFRFVNCKL